MRALVLRTLAPIYQTAGRFEDAVEAARGRARLVLGSEGTPAAEAELKSLRDLRPEDPVIQSSLGSYLAVWGGSEAKEEGLALLRAAALKDPESPELRANLGWGAYRLGVPEEAVRNLESAPESDPNRGLDRARLAHILFESGEPERASEQVKYVLLHEPGADWADEMRELRDRIASAAAPTQGPRSTQRRRRSGGAPSSHCSRSVC